MKKLIVLMLAALLLVAGCTPQIATEPTQAPATEEPQLTEAPEFTAHYTDARAKYAYIYENERDRKWEEDVVYFANQLLDPYNGHPMLSDRLTMTTTYNDLVARYSTTSSENYFDPALKEAFIAGINELIPDIPELSDAGIAFRLQKLIMPLNDVHTGCNFFSLPIKLFPFDMLEPIKIDGAYEAVVFRATEDCRDILGLRLKAVNGVPLDEIVERLTAYVPGETEDCSTITIIRGYISMPDALREIGVMGDEDTAIFTFADADGNETTRELTAADEPEPADVVYYRGDEEFCPADFRLMSSDKSVKAWYKLLSGGEALYFRLNTCMVDDSFPSLVEEAFAKASETGKLKKVIVDFRHNGGGYLDLYEGFLPLANAMRDSGAELYVMIDGLSFSASVGIPSLLKRRIEGVTLVGAPGGQPVRFFYGGYAGSFTLPNSGLYFGYSRIYGDFWPDYGDGALMPDVMAEQTYEDYIAGIDTALNCVLFCGGN